MKNAFVDINGVLTSWGYAESNGDDVLIEVAEDFSEVPGTVKTTDGGKTWVPYSPQPLPADLAKAALLVGLTIESASTPGLDGEYAVDQASQLDIIAIETGLNAGKGFPGGASTFSYPDISGEMHQFSEVEFANFAAAVRDYVYALKSVIGGASTSLPASTISIG